MNNVTGGWSVAVTDIDVAMDGWCVTVTDTDIVTGDWYGTIIFVCITY